MVPTYGFMVVTLTLGCGIVYYFLSFSLISLSKVVAALSMWRADV